MKKFLLALSLFLGTVGFAGAQTAPAKTVQKSTTTQSTEHNSTGVKLKKNGTPDKRYKENKTTTTTVEGPTKKDGTPDKRFKANKTTTTTTTKKTTP